MIAPDETTNREVMIAPLLAGFGSGADRIMLDAADRPIASAILLHMRKLAIEAHAAAPLGRGPSCAGYGEHWCCGQG